MNNIPFLIWMLAWPMVFDRSFENKANPSFFFAFFLATWLGIGYLLYGGRP